MELWGRDFKQLCHKNSRKKKARLGISAGNRNSKAGSNENSKTKKKKVPKTMNSKTDSFNIRLDNWKKNSSELEECSEENTQNEGWVTKGHIQKRESIVKNSVYIFN